MKVKLSLLILIIFSIVCITSCGNKGDKVDDKKGIDENNNGEVVNTPKPYIDGKKLVVFGDSITALGTWGKGTAEELNMYFYNAAIGGITTKQGIERFKSTVVGSEADFVTICFGQNDLIMTGYNTPRITLDEFKQNLKELIRMALDIDAKPILLTTNPLNPDIFWEAQGQDKKNYELVGDPLGWLDEYNGATREVALETGTDLVDMRKEFSEKYFRNTLSDGIHLNSRGNEIFKNALVNYFKERYDNDPNAPKVKEEDKNIYVTSSEHVSIISMNKDNWYTADNTLLKIENNNESLVFYNTNGLWPEAHYTPNPIVIDYETGVLYYDIEVKNVGTSIILFLNGSTASAYQNNEYVVINSYIADEVNAAGDIIGPKTLKGSIDLKDLNLPKNVIISGKLTISGIKVFVAGQAGQKVIINELSVGLK